MKLATWIRAFNAAREAPADTFASRDVCKITGLSEHSVGVLLRKWRREGKISEAGWRDDTGAGGRRVTIPIYRINEGVLDGESEEV